MAFRINDGKALGGGGKSVGSFESACDELSGEEGEATGFVSKERVVFSKLIKDGDKCQQVLEAAKSFKFGNEDLQEGGAFIVSDGVKISSSRAAKSRLLYI